MTTEERPPEQAPAQVRPGAEVAARPVQLLLVEDSFADAALTREFLHGNGDFDGTIEHVTRLAHALAAARATEFDLVLLDLSLPDADGLEAVRAFTERFPDAALIVVTGAEDTDLAYQAVRIGADDVLFKRDLSPHRLLRAVRITLARAESVASRRQQRVALGPQPTPDPAAIARVGPCARVVARHLESEHPRLSIDVRAPQPCLCAVTPDEVQRLIRSLLQVAIACFPPQVPVELKLRVRAQPGMACVEVRPAFADDALGADMTGPMHAEGARPLGTGLDSCRALAEALGGEVAMWTGGTRGTVLRLTLPSLM